MKNMIATAESLTILSLHLVNTGTIFFMTGQKNNPSTVRQVCSLSYRRLVQLICVTKFKINYLPQPRLKTLTSFTNFSIPFINS